MIELFGKKVLIEIIQPHNIKKRKLSVENNYVIIKKPRKKTGNPGYKAKFFPDSLRPYRTRLGLLKTKIFLIDGADECLRFRFEEDKCDVDMPVWNRDAEERLFDAAVIKSAGSVSSKLQVPGMLYVVLFMSIAVSVVILGVVTGKIQI